MKYMSVDAVVVTYNRVPKLVECLENLISIDNVAKIFVIDNASTDSTKDVLQEFSEKSAKIEVTRTKKNLGGAGGFNTGLKCFLDRGRSDFVWLMDDDTVPGQKSLALLLEGLHSLPKDRRGFAVGKTVWTDGNRTKMNIPVYADSDLSEFGDDIRTVKSASFVAILFPKETVAAVGLPIKEFFIWGDDVEYTSRITRFGFWGIEVQNAEILHKMGANNETNILNENENADRIERYFYDFRNRMYISRHEGLGRYIRTIIGRFFWAAKLVCLPTKFKARKLKILIKGTLAGFTFNPPVEKGE
jgi:GT2 family glycosyltransferase